MAVDLRPAPTEDDIGGPSPDRRRGLTVRAGLVVASTLAVWVVAPEAVRATFSGPRPFLRVVAVVAGFALWSAVVGRVVPNRWVRLGLVAVPALVFSWWALSPYLTDEVVNEDFPVAAGATTAPADDGATTERPTDRSSQAPPVATHRRIPGPHRPPRRRGRHRLRPG